MLSGDRIARSELNRRKPLTSVSGWHRIRVRAACCIGIFAAALGPGSSVQAQQLAPKRTLAAAAPAGCAAIITPVNSSNSPLNDDAEGSKEDTIYIDRDGIFHAREDDTNV